MLRAFHLEVELREMLISSWLMNGLLKRSCTAAVSYTHLDVYKRQLSVLLVGDADVNVLAQLGHSLTSLVTGPQLAAVVQVAADLHAVSPVSYTHLGKDVSLFVFPNPYL